MSIIANSDFKLDVSMGKYPGYSVTDKFGVNLNVTTAGTPADVWEFGGVYNYDADGTAPIQYLSSSNSGDTEIIRISGLDINGDEVEQDITLTGQTNASLTTPLWRVYRMINLGAVSLVGVVYCHTDATPSSGVPSSSDVRAIIDNGHNQTLMSLYTIPKGKVGFLVRGEIGIELEGNAAALAEYAHIHYESRRLGKVFTVKKAISCIVGGSAIYQDERSFPDVIPSLTDLKITVNDVSQNMGLWSTFDILLVDENQFSTAYLQGIGQPGY